jgi:hypothetical protein
MPKSEDRKTVIIDKRQPDRKTWLNDQLAAEAAARGPLVDPLSQAIARVIELDIKTRRGRG